MPNIAIIIAALGLLVILISILVSRLIRVAEQSNQLEDQLKDSQKSLKKATERMQKFEKRAQKLGTGSVSDDKKVLQLKKAVDDLRKTLASTRKTVRDAEERAESAMEGTRILQRQLDELERDQTAKSGQADATLVESTPEPAPADPVESIPADPVESTPATPVETKPQEKQRSEHDVEEMIDDLQYLRTKLSKTDKKVRSLRYDLGNARRKAEHERRAYILTLGQLELTQDLLYALEQSAGMKADDALVAMSGRAKKRREIKQARAERRLKQEQIPSPADATETKAPHTPEPVEEAAAPHGG